MPNHDHTTERVPAFLHGHAAGAVAGLAAGVTKIVSVYPLDTVKTRLQLDPLLREQGSLFVLRKTVNREGFISLYKGITAPLVGWTAIDSVLFGSLHEYRLFLLHHGNGMEMVTETGPPRLTLLAHGVAGLLAGLTSAPLATPIELLKVRLQLQMQRAVSDRQFRGPVDCLRQLVRSQGVLGLWTGFSGGLLFRANYFYMFLAFEIIVRGITLTYSRLFGFRIVSKPSVGASNLISGGVASLCFWYNGHPLRSNQKVCFASLARSRILTASSQMLANQAIKRPSFVALARQIHASEGLRGFYRGLAPCLIRALPSNACAFFVYEGILRYLDAEQVCHSLATKP
ncbi:mitochondrial carrier, partial [Roridomyces roridus]